MPTITVEPDRKRAALLARGGAPKPDVTRALIDRAGPVETADALIKWVRASEGKGLGLAERKR